MSDVIDLDALVPKSVTIKLNEELIEIKPPSMVELLRMAKAGSKLQNNNDLSPAEIETAITEVRGHIDNLIPQIGGKELSVAQMLKLVEIINEMTIPPDAEELKKRGITTDSPKAE